MNTKASSVVAIIQARLGSSRLPGKVLQRIAGRPMLEWVLRRVARTTLVDRWIVATSDSPQDDLLAHWCQQQGWPVFRGSEQNVLSRYLGAAAHVGAPQIVRITADCPLIDPAVIDRVVAQHLADPRTDYTCNFFPQRTYPRGLDCEIVTRAALERVAEMAANRPEYQEHVTLGIYRNPELFRWSQVEADGDYSHFRWTVDTPEDLQLIRKIANFFTDDHFSWQRVVAAFARNPYWLSINRHVAQKAA
jgi:spore coat polysaccharide biosynthesis protein SpsF